MEDSSDDSQIEFSDFGLDSSITSTGFSFEANSPACVKWDFDLPAVSEFKMEDSSDDSQIEFSDFGLDSSITSTGFSFEANSPACVKWDFDLPAVSEFKMEDSSDDSQIEFSDFGLDSSITSTGFSFEANSPACVKWDFDLPAVSEFKMEDSSDDSQIEFSDFGLDSSITSTGFSFEANSPACVKWDFDLPAVSEFKMEDSSDDSQIEFSDFGLDSSITSTGFSFEANSPACVKWDFDLPAVSENIKEEAKKLGEQLRQQSPIKKRKLRRRTSYLLNKKNEEITPSRHLSYKKSLKQLKEAIRGAQCSTSKGTCDSPDIFVDDQPEKKHELKEDKTLILENKDVLDDSFNDLLNECSQSVENKIYQNTTPEKDKSNDENVISSILETPKVKRTPLTAMRCTPRNLTSELEEAVDDDLFLAIDI